MTAGRPGRAEERGRRRLRAFAVHLAVYFVAVAGLFAVTVALTPGDPWMVLPIVGWGGVLAAHAAYVMGLFEGWRGK